MAAHRALACLSSKPPRLHCVPLIHRYPVAQYQQEEVPVPMVSPGAGAAGDGALHGRGRWLPPSSSKCQALLRSHMRRSSVSSPPGPLAPLHITLGAGQLLLLTQPGSALVQTPLLGVHHATLVSFIAKLKEAMSL